MSYAGDYDDYEQDAQGQDEEIFTEHDKMISEFGLSRSEFAELSQTEQSRIRWNWKNISFRRMKC